MIKVTITRERNKVTLVADGHGGREICTRLTGFIDCLPDSRKVQVPGYSKVTLTELYPLQVETLKNYERRYKDIEIIEESKND